MMRWMRWLLAVFLLFAAVPVAMAASTCTVSAKAVAFGNYTGTALSPAGSVLTLKCTSGAKYTIALSAGVSTGATITSRDMQDSAGDQVDYSLSQDSAHTTNWGNTTASEVSSTGTGANQTFTIYPSAAAGQYVPPGSYTDTITVTVSGGVTTVTTTFSVTTTVVATCTISAGSMTFLNYSGAKAVTATANISVTCTKTTGYDVGLSAGAGSGATVTNRLMTRSGVTLPYGIFQDSTHSTYWGNTVNTDTVSGTGTGAAQTLPAYGQIPAGSYVAAGTYTDTVTATITY